MALTAVRDVSAAEDRALALALLFEAWGVHGFADRVEDPPPGVLLDEGGLQRLVSPARPRR